MGLQRGRLCFRDSGRLSQRRITLLLRLWSHGRWWLGRPGWSRRARLDVSQGHLVRCDRQTQLCGIWESHRGSIDAPRRCQASNIVKSRRRDNLSIQQLDFSCGRLEQDRTWSSGGSRAGAQRGLRRGPWPHSEWHPRRGTPLRMRRRGHHCSGRRVRVAQTRFGLRRGAGGHIHRNGTLVRVAVTSGWR